VTPTPLTFLWRRTGFIIACSSLTLALFYWSTVRSIVTLWQTDTFSHGFFVIPITLYLVWARRDEFLSLKPTSTAWALPLLAVFAFGWLVAALAATDVVKQFCFIAMIIALTWGILGTRVARTLSMPLVFLLFAVPLGASLIPPLQDFSASFATKILDLSGVPVLLEGRFISVPSGRWEVAQECSGLRFLISSLAIGFLYAGLVYRTWIRRLGFFLASAVVPIIANGLRVFGIVLLAYLTENRIAAGVDHILYGWLFFTIVMFLLFSIGSLWREKKEGDSNHSGTSAALSSESAAEDPRTQEVGFSVTRTALIATFGMFLVGSAPLSLKFFRPRHAEAVLFSKRVPQVGAPWIKIDGDIYNWKPDFLAPSSEQMLSYTSGGRQVELYVAYYASDDYTAKLVSSANLLFEKERWQRSGETETLASVHGQSFRVHETFIRSQQRSLVLWSWYWIDGHSSDSAYVAKALLAKARLFSSPNDSAAIIVATEDSQGTTSRTGEADTTLRDFLSHLSP
jgi:exosortase A